MVGRGYKLVCRKCDIDLKKLTKRLIGESDDEYKARRRNCTVESKPSKYHHWECDKCGERMDGKPDSKTMVSPDNWVYIHDRHDGVECGGVIFNIGRKFYHLDCYEGMHYGSLVVAWEDLKESLWSKIKRRFPWI